MARSSKGIAARGDVLATLTDGTNFDDIWAEFTATLGSRTPTGVRSSTP